MFATMARRSRTTTTIHSSSSIALVTAAVAAAACVGLLMAPAAAEAHQGGSFNKQEKSSSPAPHARAPGPVKPHPLRHMMDKSRTASGVEPNVPAEWGDDLITLTHRNYDEVVSQSRGIVLVAVLLIDNDECRAIARELIEASRLLKARGITPQGGATSAKIAVLDLEAISLRHIAKRLNVTRVPAMRVYLDGHLYSMGYPRGGSLKGSHIASFLAHRLQPTTVVQISPAEAEDFAALQGNGDTTSYVLVCGSTSGEDDDATRTTTAAAVRAFDQVAAGPHGEHIWFGLTVVDQVPEWGLLGIRGGAGALPALVAVPPPARDGDPFIPTFERFHGDLTNATQLAEFIDTTLVPEGAEFDQRWTLDATLSVRGKDSRRLVAILIHANKVRRCRLNTSG